MRVVLDANILISAAISTAGPPREIVNAWIDGRVELIASPKLLAEVRDVLDRPRFRRWVSIATATTTPRSLTTVVAPAPAGTHGYEDLRRDATPMRLDEDLTVRVASRVDLVRIAEASEDRARVPALRRTLELSTTPPAAASADAA